MARERILPSKTLHRCFSRHGGVELSAVDETKLKAHLEDARLHKKTRRYRLLAWIIDDPDCSPLL